MKTDQKAPGTCPRDRNYRPSSWSGKAGMSQENKQYKRSAQSDSDTCPAGISSNSWRRWRSGTRLAGTGSTWFRPGCPETCRPRKAGMQFGLADPEKSRWHRGNRRSGRAGPERCRRGTGGILCCLCCFGRSLECSRCRWTGRADLDRMRASRTCSWESPWRAGKALDHKAHRRPVPTGIGRCLGGTGCSWSAQGRTERRQASRADKRSARSCFDRFLVDRRDRQTSRAGPRRCPGDKRDK